MPTGRGGRVFAFGRRCLFTAAATAVLLLLSIRSSSGWCPPSARQAALSLLAAALGGLAVLLVARVGWKRFLFFLLPQIAFLASLEIGMRVWIARFAPRGDRLRQIDRLRNPANLGLESVYVPHHYTLYNPRPMLSTPDGTVHNRLGMRDSRPLEPEDGVLRIVLLGGSTTYSIGIKDNTRIYSYGLEERLNAEYRDRLGGYRIEVINAGMGGATSAESLLRLIFFVSELSPDLVVVQHGLNDALVRTRGEIQSDFGNYRKAWSFPDPPDWFPPDRPLLSALALPVFKRSALARFVLDRAGYRFPQAPGTGEDGEEGVYTIGDMVTRTDVPTGRALLDRNGTQYFERNTRYMIALCRAMGAQVMLASEPFTARAGAARARAMPEHNALLARIAREEGVLFFDYAAEMTKDDAHLPDGRHENQAGSDLKRDLYARHLVREGVIPGLLEQRRKQAARAAQTP